MRLLGFAVGLGWRRPASTGLFTPVNLLEFMLCAAIASRHRFLPVIVGWLASSNLVLVRPNGFTLAPVTGMICRLASPIHLTCLRRLRIIDRRAFRGVDVDQTLGG